MIWIGIYIVGFILTGWMMMWADADADMAILNMIGWPLTMPYLITVALYNYLKERLF